MQKPKLAWLAIGLISQTIFSKKMKKIFLVFFSLFFISCSQEEQQPRIRIVDLQGNEHHVTTKVPDLNAQILTSQGRMPQQYQDRRAMQTPQEDLAQNSPAAVPMDLSPAPMPQPTVEVNKSGKDELLVTAGAPQNKDQETVEYSLNDGEKTAKEAEKVPAKATHKTKKEKAAAKTSGKKFFVQVGSFASISNAKRTLAEMEKFHQGKVTTVEAKKTIYRVLLGPFSNKNSATKIVKEITDSGHEAILVKNK